MLGIFIALMSTRTFFSIGIRVACCKNLYIPNVCADFGLRRFARPERP